MDRLALFIDGSFVYNCAKRMGWNVDHRKVIEHFPSGYALFNAFYYAPITDWNDERQQKFLDALIFMGYSVRSREVRGEAPNFEAQIATDLLITAPRWDVALLATGASQLVPAVEAVRTMGKEVHLLGIPELVDLDIRSATDRFIDLKSYRELLEREGGGRRVFPDVSHEASSEGGEAETAGDEEAAPAEGD
ncbi:MAG TPA: NYN domain-containing protein [Oceanithermus profundus]|uniref:NYN domain-containing protein n=1 Tax=Oceanithermus profundus TaxID=187137 RepID=A0A7C4VDQ6_9DEIN|nr:NYN domain-containing protein [Oceanithermus profundus]